MTDPSETPGTGSPTPTVRSSSRGRGKPIVPPIRSKRPQKKKGWFRNLSATAKTLTITLAVIVSLALVIAGLAGAFFWRISSSYNKNTEVIAVPFPEEEHRPKKDPEDKSQTILLVGSDTRGEVTDDILVGPQGGRSDTIMLARIPHDRDEIVFVSIMRDAWVNIPGYGMNKVNAAMAYGGVPLMVRTLEDLIGARIDQVALIDFEGFKGLTNALGGVTVNNSVPFTAGGHSYAEGPITLDGEQALMFVRTRKAFADGDYQRVRNQQAYMKGLATKLLSRETLTSPGRIVSAVDEISPFLTVSEGLGVGYATSLAPSMRNIRSEDLLFMTVPTEGPAWSDDGQSIILLDEKGMEELREAFKTDTLVEYWETHQ